MSYSRAHPSPRYQELLAQYQQAHSEGQPEYGLTPDQTFPGYSIWPHIVRIREMIHVFAAQTLLDYGSGKGTQYQATNFQVKGMPHPLSSLQDYWRVHSVTCYDPCYAPFMRLPTGKFDGVICTDMLEHCPQEDIDWILDELFAYANKFVYANIAAYPAEKNLPSGENAHCTIKPVEWWHEKFEATTQRHSEVRYQIVVVAREEQGHTYHYHPYTTRNYAPLKDSA